ncbi:MAG TPA: response regulator transcription factor [Candidatus Dormibacteraeota bacterium]|nr:response regulator transcription factor [Candidatus Dormibacteraeota bacterium]
MSNQRIRVLIVDDRPIFRAGARGMLSGYEHITVVGEATNGVEAVAQARALKPDVILMDINMPVMDGPAATAAIMKETHEVAILGLTVSDHEDDVANMLSAGASGYILKDSGPEDLARAIEDAHAGRFPLDRSVARRMVDRLAEARPRPQLQTAEPLAPKEKQVLTLVVKGLPNKAIGSALRMSEGTVKSHLRNIYRKLDVDSRAAAAALASQLDLSAE